MLLTKFSMEFKKDDWVDLTYPISVRTANIREKRAALEALGLPPPLDPVVWLDDLSKYTEDTWSEEETRRILRTHTPDDVKDAYRRLCRVVNGKKPKRRSCPSKTTFEGRLKEWRRNASYLLNFYAAGVYQDQMALIREKEDSKSPAPPKALTRTWEFEAWDKKLQKLKVEEGAGSCARRDFQDSEMAMIEGFAKHLRKPTTEANNDGSTTQIVEEKVESSDFAAATDASGLALAPGVSNNTRRIQQRRGSVMPDDVLQPPNGGSGVGLHSTPTNIPFASSKSSARSISSNSDSKIVGQGAVEGNIDGFTDHRGRSHHRGTSGKFVKGPGPASGASREMGRRSTETSSNVALGNPEEQEREEEGTEGLSSPTVAGVKRKVPAAQDGISSQTNELAMEPTKKRVKLSRTDSSQRDQIATTPDGETGGAELILAAKGSTKCGKDDKQPGKDVTASVKGAHLVPIEANQPPLEGQSSTATPRKRLILKNSCPRPQA